MTLQESAQIQSNYTKLKNFTKVLAKETINKHLTTILFQVWFAFQIIFTCMIMICIIESKVHPFIPADFSQKVLSKLY